MAPEIMVQNGYDTKVDIWSIGITCLELFEGKPPYCSYPPMVYLNKLMNTSTYKIPDIPDIATQKFKDFILKCLQIDPLQRPDINQLAEHPFIKDMSKNKADEIIQNIYEQYKEQKRIQKEKAASAEEEEDESKKKAESEPSWDNLNDVCKQLIGMGFSEKHAKKASSVHYNNITRAIDDILSNLDQLLAEDEREEEAERKRIEQERAERQKRIMDRRARLRKAKYPANSDRSKYDVFAVISHVSTEESLNHFVLHVLVHDDTDSTDKWVLCDVSKCAVAPKPPMDTGCFYLYRKSSS